MVRHVAILTDPKYMRNPITEAEELIQAIDAKQAKPSTETGGLAKGMAPQAAPPALKAQSLLQTGTPL